jgi:hypothetical protein
MPSTAGEKSPNTIWKAFNGWREESKHNLERPVETEFRDLLCPTAGKLRLPSYHYPHRHEVFLSKQGRKGKSRGIWNDGMTVNESRHGCLVGGGMKEGRILGQKGQFLNHLMVQVIVNI